jgi:hypothetical protein
MAQYKITGVWIDEKGVITHYAFHTVTQTGITRAVKKSKAQAIELLEEKENTAYTRLWNYSKPGWKDGEKVEVVDGKNGKYLRSNADDKLTDNLGHLIDFDWIAP